MERYISFVVKGEAPNTMELQVILASELTFKSNGLPTEISARCLYFHFFDGIYDKKNNSFSLIEPETPDLIYYVNAEEKTEDELDTLFDNSQEIKKKINQNKESIEEGKFGGLLYIEPSFIFVITTPYEILHYAKEGSICISFDELMN